MKTLCKNIYSLSRSRDISYFFLGPLKVRDSGTRLHCARRLKWRGSRGLRKEKHLPFSWRSVFFRSTDVSKHPGSKWASEIKTNFGKVSFLFSLSHFNHRSLCKGFLGKEYTPFEDFPLLLKQFGTAYEGIVVNKHVMICTMCSRKNMVDKVSLF